MRAAELIGSRVVDADGTQVGVVHDLHFRLIGRPDGEVECELDMVECGGIAVGHRLGYGHAEMTGPWPIPRLFRLLSRRSLVFGWSDVARLQPRLIVLRVRRADLARRPVRGEESA